MTPVEATRKLLGSNAERLGGDGGHPPGVGQPLRPGAEALAFPEQTTTPRASPAGSRSWADADRRPPPERVLRDTPRAR